MRVLNFDNPAAFAERVTALLVEHEAENCLILGRMSELAAAQGKPAAAGELLWAVEDGGRIVAAAMLAPPRPMVVTPAPPGAIAALADHFKRSGVSPNGVNAPEPAASLFLRAWADAPSAPASDQALGLFRLARVTPPARPGRGTARAAGEADADRLVPWAEAFLRDVDMPKGRHECAGMMAERIREQRLFVWCDPEPVSMAGWAGRTPNGVRVNFVYTPPECRGRGYASACVAALSQHLLDSGRKFCCLFTDLANPTSNKIYRAIGYRRVCDFRYVRFEPVSS